MNKEAVFSKLKKMKTNDKLFSFMGNVLVAFFDGGTYNFCAKPTEKVEFLGYTYNRENTSIVFDVKSHKFTLYSSSQRDDNSHSIHINHIIDVYEAVEFILNDSKHAFNKKLAEDAENEKEQVLIESVKTSIDNLIDFLQE